MLGRIALIASPRLLLPCTNVSTGHSKSELPPSIDGIDVEGSRLSTTVFKVEPDSLVQLGVQAKHSQSVPLTAVWAVTEDLYSSAIGGAFENTLPLLRGLWQGSNSSTTLGLSPVLNTSSLALGRSYRLYIFVRRDTNNFLSVRPEREAHASLAFQICHDAVLGEECHNQIEYGSKIGIHSNPEISPGINASSS